MQLLQLISLRHWFISVNVYDVTMTYEANKFDLCHVTGAAFGPNTAEPDILLTSVNIKSFGSGYFTDKAFSTSRIDSSYRSQDEVGI